MSVATLAMFTIDCAVVGPVAEFWAKMLGLESVAASEDYAMLKGPDGPAIGFGKVEGYQAPGWPNKHGSKQFHFDLAVPDIDAATQKCVDLGATLIDDQPGETWRVLLDPAGHAFCLTNAANWG